MGAQRKPKGLCPVVTEDLSEHTHHEIESVDGIIMKNHGMWREQFGFLTLPGLNFPSGFLNRCHNRSKALAWVACGK